MLATLREAIFESQILKLELFSSKYESCSNKAHKYDEGKSFRICSIRIHGNAHALVVFDSGGEIALPRDQQSSVFREFLLRHEKPVVYECDQVVRAIKRHWYYVEANCG
jgi:hypothetical protein